MPTTGLADPDEISFYHLSNIFFLLRYYKEGKMPDTTEKIRKNSRKRPRSLRSYRENKACANN